VKLFLALLLVALAIPAWGDSEASRLARKARKAQSSGDLTEAYLLYTRASTLDPGNKGYRAKVSALSAKVAPQARQVQDFSEPASGADLKPALDPSTVFDSLDSVTNLQPAAELHARQDRMNINLEGDFKTLFTQVASLFQLDCVFDSDYEPGRAIHFVLNQADYRDALYALSAATNSFVVPVSAKVFVVAKDMPQKRTDLEQAMCVTVPIPQYISVQELVEIAQAVRQASGVEKLSWDNKTGSVIMRDRVSRVKPAQALFYDLFAFRPEVMIDLQLIEITRSDIVNYGINLPNMFNIVFTGQGGSNTTSSSGTLPSTTENPFPFNSLSYIFTALGSQGASSVAQAIVRGLFPTSLSLFSIGIGEANALVNFSNSLGKTILTQNLRSVDAQAATFHYGQKYPILTGSYGASATVGSQFLPTPSFTFEDLGVSLKVTPHIHGTETVSLDVESEFKLLSGASIDGNPIISTRKLKSTVNLGNNEWAVVAGLQQNSDIRNVAGTRGLSEAPILSEIFSQHKKEKDRSEILILMRPHLLSLPGNQTIRKDVWVGTETRPKTPL
jgi:general secretion pathway protein D